MTAGLFEIALEPLLTVRCVALVVQMNRHRRASVHHHHNCLRPYGPRAPRAIWGTPELGQAPGSFGVYPIDVARAGETHQGVASGDVPDGNSAAASR
jgi:hypothetical protein